MTHNLGYWWPFAQTVWGWTVATIGGLAALYYGPKKMLETFDWYMDRFVDYKVSDFLHAQIHKAKYILPDGGVKQWADAKPVADIAKATGMSEKRVLKCLERLKRKKCVRHAGEDLWKADISHVSAL